MKKIFLLIFSVFTGLLGMSQVVVNEFSASNYTDWNTGGEFEDWIELYNPSGAAVDISGYFLSDRIDNPTKWEIPAGTSIAANDHLVFLCTALAGINDNAYGYLNTNFKITQTNSEAVVFSDNTGTILESYEFDVIGTTQANHSWARAGDGNPNWIVYSDPNPNGSNNGTTYSYYSQTPILDIQAGYYAGAQTLNITAAAGSTIYYTTDGSTPNNGSTVYGGPIAINASMVIRAIAYDALPLVLPSFVETNTYFINTDIHEIPIMAISGGTLSDGQWFGDEETVIEYFDENGTFVSEGHGESNEHGNDSNAYGQRGFDYIDRDQKGYDHAVEALLFPESSDRTKFQRLIFKAAANDNYSFENGGAHVRDLYCHILSEKADLKMDERTGVYCILYINGEYWGVYDVREKADDLDYTRYYYDQPEGFVDYLKTWGGTWADYGDGNDWDDLVDFITSNDMTDAANYDYVQSQFNTNSLIDYFVMNSYVVTADWLNWNTAWWRGRHPDGDHKKWAYVLWDMDATFGHYINYTGIDDQGSGADPCNPEVLGDPGGQGHVPVLNALFDNESFEADYINRYASLSNSYFSCEYMVGLLDSLENVIAPEMQRQIDRWGGGTYAGWTANVQEMRDFIEERCSDEIIGGIEDCYDVEAFTLTVQIVGDGTVEASTVTVTLPNSPWTGTFFSDLIIPFEAIDGTSTFVTWEIAFGDVTIADLTNPNIEFEMTGDVTLVAYFEEPQPQEITFMIQPAGAGDIILNSNTLSVYPYVITLPFGSNELDVTANEWFEFDHWETLNNSFTPNDTLENVNLFVSSVDTVIAVFIAIDHYIVTIGDSFVTDGSDAIVTENGNTINPYTWESDVASGTTISLTTSSDNPWAVFDSWVVTGDIQIVGDPTDQDGTFVINGEGTITPVYIIIPHYEITVSVFPEGAGSVTMNGTLLSPLPYAEVLEGEIDIPFVAEAFDEWTFFSHWEFQSATITPDINNESINANFINTDHLIAVFNVVPHHEITLIVKPTNGGSVLINNEVRTSDIWTGELAGNIDIPFVGSAVEFHTFEKWQSNHHDAFSSNTDEDVVFVFYQQDTIIAYFPQDDEQMFIPNSFSPNDDGINDFFLPLSYAFDLTTYKIQIFDRWGMKVFETTDSTKAWNGSYNNGAYYVPNDTYTYILTIRRISDTEVQRFDGQVTLMR